MAEGFLLKLQDYCSNCGEFEPDVEKIVMKGFGDNVVRYNTVIQCQHVHKCAQIKKNLENRYK